MGKFNDKTGETNLNTNGCLMEIIEYFNSKNIVVMFLDSYRYKKKTGYKQFKIGNVRNPYDKTYFGVGFSGVGKYNMYEGKKTNRVAQCWVDMLDRCYGIAHKEKYKTYKNCVVCDSWHNFQNFAEWYYNNNYDCEENLNLDKDIIYSGNNIYSPERCMLVPQSINKAAINWNGVSYHSRDLCWQAYIIYNKKQKYLGRFETEKEGRKVYLKYKNKLWQEIIDSWKDSLPNKVYDACKKKVFI